MTGPGAVTGLDADVLEMTIDAIQEFADRHLSTDLMLQLDHEDKCPEDLVRKMCGDELGIQLLFIAESYGGMGGGTFDVYRVCERMAAIDLGVATSVLATFLGSDPILVGATEEQKKLWLGKIAEEGILFAYGATEPEAGSDLGALEDDRGPGHAGRRRRRLRDQRPQAVDQQRRDRRRLHHSGQYPRRSVLVRRRAGRRRVHPRPARGQARHPSEQHVGVVPRRRQGRAGRPRGRGRGPGPGAGPAGVRVHPADGRRLRVGRRLVGDGQGDRLLDRAHPGRRAAVGEAGVHPQAHRPPRGPAGGRPRVHRGDRRTDRRRRGLPQHRGRDRQVPVHRGGQRRRRGRHPGPRRLRLHPRVPGREDQARRAHHHDLRGHVGDHGDDHRPRPVAGAPQDPRSLLPRPGRRRRGPGGQPSRGRRRHRRPGVARPGRDARVVPDGPPDPQPARAAPAGRAHRLRRVRRDLEPAGRPGRRR